jgi:dipeptidyl aminopeptidase/acylaminoacyl peptidase
VADGKSRAVIDETAETFVFVYGNSYRRDIDGGKEIIWRSERDGWNHLYLHDGVTGKVKNQITKGKWVVREVVELDEEKRQIIFKAGGREKGQDPYYLHYYRINFDGSDLVHLTPGDGTHSVQYSADRSVFIDTWSRVDLPPRHVLRRTSDGKQLCELETADAKDLYAAGWQHAERFVAKDRDGKFDIHGIICRPMNFDPKKKYPVVEVIYAGPHGSFVPKGWRSRYGHWRDELMELGFITVQIDGKGTNHRGREFQHFAYKNINDAGFPDRIKWMKEAAKKYPYMDISRVGIYGGSAGGQNAMAAMLWHGEFYKAAAADCGCHDNRMDKVWWNEQWMDYPVGPHYAEQSNTVNAHRLQGALLLTVGELDTNVDPSSTYQVVNALIKADKDFEFLMFPGGGHGIGESRYAARKRLDFFVRHLHGVEPRAK